MHFLQLGQFVQRRNAAGSGNFQPGDGQQFAVQVHVGALHRAVPGNISGDDSLDAHPGAAAAERHARLGGNFLPAIHGYQAVFHVDAHGNLCAVLLRHLGGKGKVFHGDGAQDAAVHA